MSIEDKQERIFIEAFRREYVAVDENRNLKHQGTEQIALAAFRAWKASAPSSTAPSEPKEPTGRQYYYKNNDCKAPTATHPDCICWHDEGQPPIPVMEQRTLNLKWRDAPRSATAPAFKCHGEDWNKPRCDKWCGADECTPR